MKITYKKRDYISEYILIGTKHHKQYGIAYVKENIENAWYKDHSENIQILTTILGIMTVRNSYKAPNNK